LNIINKEYPGKTAIKISNPIFCKDNEIGIENQSKQYIAWLGLYQYQKNLRLLYEIALSLKNEQFMIAGKEESKCDEETHSYLSMLKKLPNVTFSGFLHREQVLPFLSKAKFLLNTSHYEGFSNTFLEAMTVGTPIITSRNVNPDSIITKYNLGMVYNDSVDLQKQFSSLTPGLYKVMARNVREYVNEHHNYKFLANRLISFLKNN
jgi:glycosyltransferase involved in cell wall biosynthesis